MTDRKITAIQQNIWIITASISPLLFYSDGNWLGSLLYGTGISLITWCATHYGRHWDGVIYNMVQGLWLAVLLSQFLAYSGACWPTGESTFPVVPLALLALGTVSALKGSGSTAGGISVLFWIAAFLIGIVSAAGVPEWKIAYLSPDRDNLTAGMMLSFFLPAITGFLHRERNGKLAFALVVVLGAVVAAWISGILSPLLSGAVKWPFYEAAKSVQLFDVAKRLESLVSVGVTVGNYALCSLFLCAVRNIGDKFGRGRESVLLAAGICGSLMLLQVVIAPEISVVICGISWVFLPLLGMLKKNRNE